MVLKADHSMHCIPALQAKGVNLSSDGISFKTNRVKVSRDDEVVSLSIKALLYSSETAESTQSTFLTETESSTSQLGQERRGLEQA